MNIIDIENKYGKELIDLKNSYNDQSIHEDYKKIVVRGFNVPKTLHEGRLLFVGLNPSFSETKGKIFNDVNYYVQPSDDVNSYPTYYNEIRKLSENVNLQWTHWDLFYIQETKQKRATEFAELNKRQLKLSIEIIKAASPIIIVVNNAYGSKLLYETAMKNCPLNQKLGTYEFPVSNEHSVPIFFCSMLSGQRAMDTHTKERLAWHIKFTLTKL